MSVKAEIKGMEKRVFSQEFFSYLSRCYEERNQEPYFHVLQEEYDAAKSFFSSSAYEEEANHIKQWESIQKQRVACVGKFSYLSGVFEAFEQYFHPDRPAMAPFSNLVSKSVMDHQKAMLDPEYNDLTKRADALGKHLSKHKGEHWIRHFTSVGSYWDQRLFSTSMDGFYLGYRSCLKMIGRMHPDRSAAMISNVLLTEYALGLTQPLSLRES